MRTYILGGLASGMSRLHIRGGASPRGLYELTNGYVDLSGTARSRAGTVSQYDFPGGTHGLVRFNGKFHVFASAPVDLTLSTNPPVVDVLHFDPSDPNVIAQPAGTVAVLVKIHYAKPFMDALYVVAEWGYGSDTYFNHYWLQVGTPWIADHVYLPHTVESDKLTTPQISNGFYYKPTPLNVPDEWKKTTPRAVGDTITPTSSFIDGNIGASDYKMKVIDVVGTTPSSGLDEPKWSLTLGAKTYEYYQPGETDPGTGTTGGGNTATAATWIDPAIPPGTSRY